MVKFFLLNSYITQLFLKILFWDTLYVKLDLFQCWIKVTRKQRQLHTVSNNLRLATEINQICIKNIYVKKYSKIYQHLAWHLEYYGACLPSPPPFLCSQIITPFLNSMISTNQETVLEFQPIVESLYPYYSSSVKFLLCEFSTKYF